MMAYLHAVAWLTDENEDYWMASVLCICVIKNCYELNVTRMSFGPLQMQIKGQERRHRSDASGSRDGKRD